MNLTRDELAHHLPERPCCRKSMLAGLTAGLAKDGGRIATASAATARAVMQLARETGISVERHEAKHGVVLQVGKGGEGPSKRRRCCRRGWLRGAFLINGTLTDPHKGYNIEWAGAKALLEQIAQALDAEEVRTRLYERTPGHWILYNRNAEDISTILAAIGATTSLLSLEDVRLEKEIRNTVHRQVNYETANLNKTVATGLRQADEITRMREMGLLDALPEPLRQAALLREKHPYASLIELCEMAQPPVSKSGMNHRLRKLHAIMRAQSGEAET